MRRTVDSRTSAHCHFHPQLESVKKYCPRTLLQLDTIRLPFDKKGRVQRISVGTASWSCRDRFPSDMNHNSLGTMWPPAPLFPLTLQVFETLGRCRDSLERHLGPMLRWAEHAPVSETIVKLLTFPSVTGTAASYQVKTKHHQCALEDVRGIFHLLRVSVMAPSTSHKYVSLFSYYVEPRQLIQRGRTSCSVYRSLRPANGGSIPDWRIGGSFCGWRRIYLIERVRIPMPLLVQIFFLRYENTCHAFHTILEAFAYQVSGGLQSTFQTGEMIGTVSEAA